jgi:starch synthase
LATKQNLRICLASSELSPFAKTGGLADVVPALSEYLHAAGHDVRVLIPRYARLDRQGLTIEPVTNLQDLTMRVGPWDLSYSIDTTILPGTDLPVYLLRCPALYGRDSIYTQDDDEHLRFILLSRAAIEMCQRMRFSPHIFHSHDWHTALIPLYLRTVYAWDALFASTKSVLTIHNIGYQGIFSADILPDLGLRGDAGQLHQEDLNAGRINFMKTGVLFADVLTTVSPRYAQEIQGAEYGMGLDGLLRERAATLVGILNGVDYDEWNPATDTLIPNNYTSDNLRGKALCKQKLTKDLGLLGGAQRPLIGLVTRLVGQKGIDLIEEALPDLLRQRDFSFVVLGSGEARYERFFTRLQQHFSDRVCFYRGFNNELSHWIEAASDMFLMPSLYEPCGLNQMYSLKYGTVPVVRETGGLADSVQMISPSTSSGTGILFRDYSADGLRWAMNTALDLYTNKRFWRKIVHNGMAMDFSWQQQGERYVDLFRRLSEPL